MPRSRDGRVGQRGERGDGRGQLADVVQVGVDAVQLARCRSTVSPSRSSVDVGAHRSSRSRSSVAGLGRVLRPVRARATRPPVTSGGGQERARRWTGRARPGRRPRCTGPGSTRHTRPASASSTVDADAAQHLRRSSRCAAATATGAPVVLRRHALVEPGAGEQQRGHELAGRRTRRSATLAAAHGARAAHGERQPAPPPSSSTATPRPRRAVAARSPSDGAGRRVAVEARRPAAERGDRRHEAHDGAGEPAVDRCRPPQPSGCHQPVGPERPRARHLLDPRAERGQGAGHQRGVARMQGPRSREGPSARAASTR